MRLVRHYGLKTTRELRQNWLDTIHLMLDILGIPISSDSIGQLNSVRHYVLLVHSTKSNSESLTDINIYIGR